MRLSTLYCLFLSFTHLYYWVVSLSLLSLQGFYKLDTLALAIQWYTQTVFGFTGRMLFSHRDEFAVLSM